MPPPRRIPPLRPCYQTRWTVDGSRRQLSTPRGDSKDAQPRAQDSSSKSAEDRPIEPQRTGWLSSLVGRIAGNASLEANEQLQPNTERENDTSTPPKAPRKPSRAPTGSPSDGPNAATEKRQFEKLVEERVEQGDIGGYPAKIEGSSATEPNKQQAIPTKTDVQGLEGPHNTSTPRKATDQGSKKPVRMSRSPQLKETSNAHSTSEDDVRRELEMLREQVRRLQEAIGERDPRGRQTKLVTRVSKQPKSFTQLRPGQGRPDVKPQPDSSPSKEKPTLVRKYNSAPHRQVSDDARRLFRTNTRVIGKLCTIVDKMTSPIVAPLAKVSTEVHPIFREHMQEALQEPFAAREASSVIKAHPKSRVEGPLSEDKGDLEEEPQAAQPVVRFVNTMGDNAWVWDKEKLEQKKRNAGPVLPKKGERISDSVSPPPRTTTIANTVTESLEQVGAISTTEVSETGSKPAIGTSDAGAEIKRVSESTIQQEMQDQVKTPEIHTLANSEAPPVLSQHASPTTENQESPISTAPTQRMENEVLAPMTQEVEKPETTSQALTQRASNQVTETKPSELAHSTKEEEDQVQPLPFQISKIAAKGIPWIDVAKKAEKAEARALATALPGQQKLPEKAPVRAPNAPQQEPVEPREPKKKLPREPRKEPAASPSVPQKTPAATPRAPQKAPAAKPRAPEKTPVVAPTAAADALTAPSSQGSSEQSLLEELFPEASSYIQPHYTARNPYPKLELPKDMPLVRPTFTGAAKTQRQKMVESFQNRRDPLTALQLLHCSTALTEEDFRRLVPKGKHIETWVRDGEFHKVIPGRDPLTLDRLPFYYLIFKSPDSALAYQNNVARLHKLTGLHQPSSIFSAIPPPRGFLEDGEDLDHVMSSYLLKHTSLQLNLNMVMQPYNPNLRALIEQGGYKPIVPSVSEKGTPIWKVLLQIDGWEPKPEDLFHIFTRHAYDRGLVWPFHNSEAGIRKLRDVIDLKARLQPVSSANPRSMNPASYNSSMRSGNSSANGDEIGDVLAQLDPLAGGRESGGLSQIVMNRVYNRWIVEFEDEGAARRFARLWNRRVLPSPRVVSWRDVEEPRMVNAEFLW